MVNWQGDASLRPKIGQVRSACMPRWQPCVRAQATLYKKKHYLPVMKATNSDSKRCQVSVDVSLQSPSCFQRKKARTFSSQAKGGRPHRLLLGGVQSKQRRNHLCGGNVLMYAANFQYLVVTTADHGKNANWCTAVSMRACHKCRISCQGADQSIPTGGGIMRRSIFRISMSYLRTSLGYSVRWPAAKQATGVITNLGHSFSKIQPIHCGPSAVHWLGHSHGMKFCTLGMNEQHTLFASRRLRAGRECVVVHIGNWHLMLFNAPLTTGYEEFCIGNPWGKDDSDVQNCAGRANWRCTVVTKAWLIGRWQHKIVNFGSNISIRF